MTVDIIGAVIFGPGFPSGLVDFLRPAEADWIRIGDFMAGMIEWMPAREAEEAVAARGRRRRPTGGPTSV